MRTAASRENIAEHRGVAIRHALYLGENRPIFHEIEELEGKGNVAGEAFARCSVLVSSRSCSDRAAY